MQPKENLTIVLADDHKLFREGLKVLLQQFSCIKKIIEVENGQEFVDIVKEKKSIDIVFMDIEMPIMDGITATKEGLKHNPNLKIIALSMYGEEDYYTQMINAGAKGFMLKNSGIDDVEKAIKTIINGHNYFSPEILESLIKSFGKQEEKEKTSRLTEREEEVLFLICKGFSNQEIADKLYLSKRTVDKHRENLLSKTQAKNTAGLVIYAVKNNIVEV
jgi:DNA-binding NarL/FixJ family response regulator